MQIFERIRRKVRTARDTMQGYDKQLQRLRSPRRAPRTFGVFSASGLRMGLIATIGVAGCPPRTISKNARSEAAKSSALWGVRVQQLVPKATLMRSAGRAAISWAEGTSPRAAPA